MSTNDYSTGTLYFGFVKINFKGSINNYVAVERFIICNWTCMLLKARVAHYEHASVLVTKGRSLRDGDNAVVQASFNKFIIEVDN